MKFVIIGRTRLLVESAKACIAAGHEPVAVIAAKSDPEWAYFDRYAKHLGVPFTLGLAAWPAADVAISINWPSVIQDLPGYPVLNAHAGDLPRYRGNACPNWAIINGESHVSVCIHRMVEELDAGPIYYKGKIKLTDQTYIGDVYEWLDKVIPRMFADAVTNIGRLTPAAQVGTPLRCYPRIPSDSRIDWRQSAEQIARLVRASSKPFDGAYSYHDGQRVTIWRAHAEAIDHDYLGIPGQVIALDPLKILTGNGSLVLETHDATITSTRSRLT